MFGEKKRTYKGIQLVILRKLRTKQKTIYQIAKQSKTHFRTIRHQLALLTDLRYVELIFQLDHIKVVAITKQGYKHLRKLER